MTQTGKTEGVAAVDALCCDVVLTEDEEAACRQVHGLLPTAAAELISLERIRKLHRQDKANSFLLPLPERSGTEHQGERATGRAVAIYPRVLALANHSCWPSAVRIDPSPQHTPALAPDAAASLSYRALEALPAGTEVTQSYVGIGWPQRPEEGEMSAEEQARFVPRKDYLRDEYLLRPTMNSLEH